MSIQAGDTYLNAQQQQRAEALRHAHGVLLNRQPMGGHDKPDAIDLHNLADYIISGGDPWKVVYPYDSGEHVVLGPETFKDADGKVISHKGENYYRAVESPDVRTWGGESVEGVGS